MRHMAPTERSPLQWARLKILALEILVKNMKTVSTQTRDYLMFLTCLSYFQIFFFFSCNYICSILSKLLETGRCTVWVSTQYWDIVKQSLGSPCFDAPTKISHLYSGKIEVGLVPYVTIDYKGSQQSQCQNMIIEVCWFLMEH